MVVLGRVVVVALVTVSLADDHVVLDRVEPLQSGDVGRDGCHVGTLAEQRVLARAARRRTGKLLDTAQQQTTLVWLARASIPMGQGACPQYL